MCKTAEQMPRKILDGTRSARVIQVIETKADRGFGTKPRPSKRSDSILGLGWKTFGRG